MTLTETIKAIKKEVDENCTPEQQAKFKSMGLREVDEMVHIGQSMGVSSAISIYL